MRPGDFQGPMVRLSQSTPSAQVRDTSPPRGRQSRSPMCAGASELVAARRLPCPHRPTFRERTRTRSRICGWTPFRVIPIVASQNGAVGIKFIERPVQPRRPDRSARAQRWAMYGGVSPVRKSSRTGAKKSITSVSSGKKASCSTPPGITAMPCGLMVRSSPPIRNLIVPLITQTNCSCGCC